jgi:hypothetical protein
VTTFRVFVSGLSPELVEFVRSASAAGAIPTGAHRALSEDDRSRIATQGLAVFSGSSSDVLGLTAGWRLTTFGELVRSELEARSTPTRRLAAAFLAIDDARTSWRRHLDGIEPGGPDDDGVAEGIVEDLDQAGRTIGALVERIADGQV